MLGPVGSVGAVGSVVPGGSRDVLGELMALTGEEEQEFGLGYVFKSDYWGQGYATEGCRAVMDYAFGQLGADRIATGTGAANERSCRLLRRLGLRETGQSTGSFWKTPDGDPIEFLGLSFAISRDEWLALRGREDGLDG